MVHGCAKCQSHCFHLPAMVELTFSTILENTLYNHLFQLLHYKDGVLCILIGAFCLYN